MTEPDPWLLGIAAFLVLNVPVGLVRLVRGPTDTDRIVSAYLIGTLGVGLFAVLGELADERALRDAALVLALLSCVLAAAFASRPVADRPHNGSVDGA